ncbi:MAG: hypothetical protein WA814_12720 [Candidatus Baltobacteraceae bacterium]
MLAAIVVGVCAQALAGCGGSPGAPPTMGAASRSVPSQLPAVKQYTFATLDDQNDSTYNKLLGINNEGKLAGYYGNGSTGHPNRGYIVYRPYGPTNYRNENYPGAVDTQVWALNNKHAIAGLFIASTGQTFGFIQTRGVWTSYRNPHLRQGNGNVTELLGLNDAGLAVGFYEEGGVKYAFELNEGTGKFHNLAPPSGNDSVATGINGKGDIVGYLKLNSGGTVGFLLKGGTFNEFSYPGSSNTQPYAVNWQDEIVGSYVDASGNTHGFTLSNPLNLPQWQSIDEPQAVGVTVVTSLNNHHYLTGYFVDSDGHTNGFLATPQSN